VPEPLPFGAEPFEVSFEDIPLTPPTDGPPENPFGASGDSFSEASFLNMTPPASVDAALVDPFATAPLRDPSPTVPEPAPPAPPPPAPDSIFETATFDEAPFSPSTEGTGDADAGPSMFEETVFDAPAFEDATFEAPSFEGTTFGEATGPTPPVETPDFEEFTFEEAAFEEAPSASTEPAPAAAKPAETSWVSRPNTSNGPNATAPVLASAEEFFGFTTPPSSKASPEPAAPEPAVESPAAENPFEKAAAGAPADEAPAEGLVDLNAFAVSAPEAAAEPAPFDTPEGADDLTVISTIDEDTQRRLYMAGVLTLEEIAQWGRGDARRISSKVDVSDETIMNQWVFEAQAALFRQYAEQAGG